MNAAVEARLLESALSRRIFSYMSTAAVVSTVASAAWALLPFAVGWRSEPFDAGSALAFGAATFVLLGAEQAILAPGFFAGRQPRRRSVLTSLVFAAACGALGAAMAACAGATAVVNASESSDQAVWGVALAGGFAGALHGRRRALRRAKADRLGDLDLRGLVVVAWHDAVRGAVLTTVITLWCLGASRSTAVAIYASCVHAWLGVAATAAVASAGLTACALEPLNFRVAARTSNNTTKAAELLVFALGLGDVGAPDDVALRQIAGARDRSLMAGTRQASSFHQRGDFFGGSPGQQQQIGGGGAFYATAVDRDPFAEGSGFDASCPMWRREIEAHRSATFASLRRLGPADTGFSNAPPPPLALASGGTVLGDFSRYSLALRLSKFLALRSLATAPTSPILKDDEPLAAVLIQGRAGDAAVAKIIRSCLLVLDSLTFRVDLAAGVDPTEDSRLENTRAAAFATKFFQGRDTYRPTGLFSAFFQRALSSSSSSSSSEDQKNKTSSTTKTTEETKATSSQAFGSFYFGDSDFATCPWGPGRDQRKKKAFFFSFFSPEVRSALKAALLEAMNPLLSTTTSTTTTSAPAEKDKRAAFVEFSRTPSSRSRALDDDLSPLECLAATFAVRAATNVFVAAKDDDDRLKERLPLVLCSFLAAKRALSEISPFDTPEHDDTTALRQDLIRYLDDGLALLCTKYATFLSTVAFPPLEAPGLKHLVDSLAAAASNDRTSNIPPFPGSTPTRLL